MESLVGVVRRRQYVTKPDDRRCSALLKRHTAVHYKAAAVPGGPDAAESGGATWWRRWFAHPAGDTREAKYLVAFSKKVEFNAVQLQSRRTGNFVAVAIALCMLALVEQGDAQHCGTLTQAQICREDCGSCGAAPCCILEWEFPQTSARDLVNKLIKVGEAWGPDLLFRLHGHTPSYTSWSYDIFDESPMNVQLIHTPVEWAADDHALSEDRVDQIAVSVYHVTATSSRVVAYSQTKRATVPFQCDLGSNYKGLFLLVTAAEVPEYKERTLYGCMGREFGVIPPEAYPNYDPLSGTTTTSFP